MQDVTSQFKPGSQYGDYVLRERVGAGGAGEVWRAENVFTRVEVAMKFCHDPTLRETLLNEAQTLGEILRASGDAGFPATVAKLVETHLSQDPPCIVMEFCAGGDLRSVLQKSERLAPAVVAEIAAQAARGLEWAHQRQILHRDIKPENLLLKKAWEPGSGEPPQVKVSDFGLGRVATTRALSIHRSIVTGGMARDEEGGIAILEGTSGGTVEYMSPEQLDNGAIAPSSDVYSLGVVIFELLTGRRPRGNVRLTSLVGGLAPAWDELFERCYQYEPDRRFQSARELLGFLEGRLGVAGSSAGAAAAAAGDAKKKSGARVKIEIDTDKGAGGRAHVSGLEGSALGAIVEKVVSTIATAGQRVEEWAREQDGKPWSPGTPSGEGAAATRAAAAAAAEAEEEAPPVAAADADAFEQLRQRTRRNLNRNWFFRMTPTENANSAGCFILANDEGHHLAQWTHQEAYTWPDQPAPQRAARAEWTYRLVRTTLVTLMILLWIPGTAAIVHTVLPIPGLSAMPVLWIMVMWVISWHLLGDFFVGVGAGKKTRAILHAFSNLQADLSRVQENANNENYLEVLGPDLQPIGFLNKEDWSRIGILDVDGTPLGAFESVKRVVKVDGEKVKGQLGFSRPGEKTPSALIGVRRGKPVLLMLADDLGAKTRLLLLNAAMAHRLHQDGNWS